RSARFRELLGSALSPRRPVAHHGVDCTSQRGSSTAMRGRPSQTAEVVCLMRASDQRRPSAERILDDPYARWFLGPMSRAALASWEASGRGGKLAERLSPGLTAFVLTRHRWIDDCLRRALARDVEQVVLLGAGYDTRAYRFASELAGRPVFEVDFPATSRR